MSQTSGASGNDPEKDEWLKQFSGIPESYAPEDLTNDRPYFDSVMQKRADGLSIEGQIEGLGDAAAGLKAKFGHDPDDRPVRSLARRAFYGAIVVGVFCVLVSRLVF